MLLSVGGGDRFPVLVGDDCAVVVTGLAGGLPDRCGVAPVAYVVEGVE